MKRSLTCMMLLVFTLFAWGEAPQEFIEKAFEYENKDIDKAIEIMKRAKKEFPTDPDILSVYGYMTGKGAGETYMLRAALLASQAESAFDTALKLESNHKNARMWRGILKVNMPSFLGKVPDGIADLEIIRQRSDLTEEESMMTDFFLGLGFGKLKEYELAIAYFSKVEALEKGDEFHSESIRRAKNIMDILNSQEAEQSN